MNGRARVLGLLVLLMGGVAYSLLRTPSLESCPMAPESIGTFVRVDGGGFVKGAHGVYPEEGRPAQVFVSPFLIQVNEVTNDQFSAFVAATGYVTEAERRDGSALFVATDTPEDLMSWWRLDRSATWRTPEGSGSSLQGRGRHPVVHVTLNDSKAYAAWAGGRIPNEIEWEYAAGRGLFDPKDPESGMRGPTGEALANTWDGEFPSVNTRTDGYAGTAPVGCYAKTRIGAYDMIGNVWEWTDTVFESAPERFTIKGGSYLCGSSYCSRYRVAARQGLEPDFSTAHVGFRIVKDL
ncbi:MAG: SUMF1/EgtB/PvdO family nonheme iron enzyme [Myxococcota bacterium]